MDAAGSQILVKQSPESGHQSRLPRLTLAMAGTAVLIACIPGASAWLIYDRSAILSGQVWRMFSGHWVHFSPQHLAYDVLALGAASWMVEASRLPRFGWLCLAAPWMISAFLLVFEPQMQFCGGLSGIATSAIVFLAASGMREASAWGWICRAVLLATLVKIVVESRTGTTILVTTDTVPAIVSVWSHIAGAVIGLAFATWRRPTFSRAGIM